MYLGKVHLLYVNSVTWSSQEASHQRCLPWTLTTEDSAEVTSSENRSTLMVGHHTAHRDGGEKLDFTKGVERACVGSWIS